MYFIARSFRVGADSGALTTSRSQRPVLDTLSRRVLAGEVVECTHRAKHPTRRSRTVSTRIGYLLSARELKDATGFQYGG
jgi:hypothetical protein